MNSVLFKFVLCNATWAQPTGGYSVGRQNIALDSRKEVWFGDGNLRKSLI